MKKTLLLVLLGAAAGVAGYQLYKKHAEQVEDIYAQEASEHQFGAYISKPVKADDAEPEPAGKEPSEELEAVADAETAEVPEEAPVADASAGEENPKRARKSEAKKD